MNDLTSIKETGAPVNIATPLPDGQTVTEVKHWTEKLFSFRLTRPQSLRFRSGEFVMIGLRSGDKPENRSCAPIRSPRRPGTRNWNSIPSPFRTVR
jgi:ferredoxin--NADP+ reductase